MSRMPIRKVGIEMPTSDTVRNTFDSQLSRWMPVYTPIGMPSAMANRAAASASSSVAGKPLGDQPHTGCFT